MPTPSYDQYINKYVSPNNTEYWLRDEEARELIDALTGSTNWLGVTTTAISDGLNWLDTTTSPATVKPITVDGESITPVNGNIASYNNKEFIITVKETGGVPTSAVWQEFGDLSSLGTLAYKDSVSGSTSYTPSGSVTNTSFSGTKVNISGTITDGTFTGTAGSVSVSGNSAGSVNTPAISVKTAGATAVFAKTVATAAPGATAPSNPVTVMDVVDHKLRAYQVGYTTGNAKTGDAAYENAAISFTPASMTLTGSFTPSGSVSGSTVDISVEEDANGNYTPSGSVSASFSGTSSTISITSD